MNLAGTNGRTALSGANYTYDENGNMTHDGRMNLDVTYDLFGMPQSVEQNGTLKCAYTYLADGTKVMVQDNANSSLSNGYLYLGSMVFKKTGTSYAFESTDFGGGRIINVNGALSPYYYTTDHLGSVRVITDANGNVVERNDYYPFGKRMTTGNMYPTTSSNRWKYNGKEVQTTGNVNWLDYGAREYDEVIGRFVKPDAYSERYPSLSLYQYAANNPSCNIDVNGDSIWVSTYNTTKDANGNSTTTNSRYHYGQDSKGNYGFLDSKGNSYSGNDKFVGQLTTALGDLSQGGPTGAELVNDLMTSTNNTDIVNRTINKADNENGAYILWNSSGTNGGPDQNGSTTRPSFIGLGHEMAHVQDVWSGTINNNTWVTETLLNSQIINIPYAELYATHIENKLRAENNIPLRASYSSYETGGIDPNTRIIRANTNESIYYNKYGHTNYLPLKKNEMPFHY